MSEHNSRQLIRALAEIDDLREEVKILFTEISVLKKQMQADLESFNIRIEEERAWRKAHENSAQIK